VIQGYRNKPVETSQPSRFEKREKRRRAIKSTYLGNEPSSEIDTSNRSRTVKVPPPLGSRLGPLDDTNVLDNVRIVLSQRDRLGRSCGVGLELLVDALSGGLRVEVWADIDRVLTGRRERSGCEKVG